MSYIGNIPTTAAFVTDQFSANGSGTTFTLSAAPATTSSILVAVSGVLQDPSTYSVSGTTLTFSAAPPAGTGNISVRFLGIPASGVVTTAYRTVTDFTATANQTTFSPPSYTAGFIDVYRNGVKLGAADFTATNGTTVVLANACTAGDLVQIVSFQVSSVLNAIPATAGAVNSTYLLDGSVTNAKIDSMAGSKLTGSQSIPKATLPTGSVLQVVNTLSATGVATSSNSVWANTGLTVTITPTSSTSRIFIVATLGDVGANATPNGIQTRILRNGSPIGSQTSNQWCYLGSGGHNINSGAISYFDTPSSTSSLVYAVQFKGQGGTGTWDVMRDNTQGCITAMEIAA